MSDFKNSKTFQNLANAFAGESQARNRYTFFASVAEKAGYQQIADTFIETANNEREHAEIYYEHMVDNLDGEEPHDMLHVENDYPVHLDDTASNLLSAAVGEEGEVEDYTEFAKVAEEEGYKDIARDFRNIAGIEAHHGKRYRTLRDNVLNERVFEKEETRQWICGVCGYIHTAKKAPEICPPCKHAKANFSLLCECY